jgi:hypothetical protein
MVQIDASPFDWLGNGSMLALHGAIDDATGKILALWLEPTECLFGYFHVLDRMIRKYGVPGIIYSDAHTIFFSPNVFCKPFFPSFASARPQSGGGDFFYA